MALVPSLFCKFYHWLCVSGHFAQYDPYLVSWNQFVSVQAWAVLGINHSFSITTRSNSISQSFNIHHHSVRWQWPIVLFPSFRRSSFSSVTFCTLLTHLLLLQHVASTKATNFNVNFRPRPPSKKDRCCRGWATFPWIFIISVRRRKVVPCSGNEWWRWWTIVGETETEEREIRQI